MHIPLITYCLLYISKVKLSCYMPWRHMGGEEVQLLLILNLGIRWRWVVSITPRPRFTPRERIPSTHWRRGWVGPRAGLVTETRRKILCLCWGSNPGCPVCSRSLYWLGYPGSCLLYIMLPKTPSTHSPWRWQLQCLKHWKTYNIRHGSLPKAEDSQVSCVTYRK
jgi:hypothetical protein